MHTHTYIYIYMYIFRVAGFRVEQFSFGDVPTSLRLGRNKPNKSKKPPGARHARHSRGNSFFFCTLQGH